MPHTGRGAAAREACIDTSYDSGTSTLETYYSNFIARQLCAQKCLKYRKSLYWRSGDAACYTEERNLIRMRSTSFICKCDVGNVWNSDVAYALRNALFSCNTAAAVHCGKSAVNNRDLLNSIHSVN